MNPLQPHVSLIVKLGSIAVHADEMLSPHGHEFDKVVLLALLKDEQVVGWIEKMNAMSMLPVKRDL